MANKALLVIGLGLAFAGCTSDGDGDGGGDVLPKRGELANDPTIVSAAARCSCGGEICSGGTPTNSHVRVRVDASDPMGATNLGSCAGTVSSASDQDSYDGAGCYLYFMSTPACAIGQTLVVGLTVSNDTGGVTTASVQLTVSE